MAQAGDAEETILADRYALREMIGAGGMSTVWRARDAKSGGDVAIKIISDSLAHDEGYLQRFRREAQIVESLDHPAIVKVLDHDEWEERPFLVMELLEAGTLADALETGAAIDSVGLARRLLDALAHIHEAGVIHRDLKPANVLVGPSGTIKLTDFGIARATEATQLTGTGLVIGTRDYMAPEVHAGEPATPRSDLFAIGTLIEETVGERPDPRLSELIATLRAENPENRPGSARDALAMIEPPEVDRAEAEADVDEVEVRPAAAAAAASPEILDPPRATYRAETFERDVNLGGEWIAGALVALALIGVLLLVLL